MKIKQKTKRNVLVGVCAAAAVLLLVFGVRTAVMFLGKGTDTSAGVEYIKKEEAGDISSIEKKIALLEQQDAGEEDIRSIKEKFSGSAVIGDSIAQGFAEYDILNGSSVAAQIGVHLTEMDPLIEKVRDLSPTVIFVATGPNDVTATEGDTEKFIAQYQEVITRLQEEVPNAHIFVNGIFPVQEKAVEKEPQLANIESYNTVLKEMCDSRSIGFIDNEEILSDEYYESDGMHFKASFYTIWAERMAEVASL